jgi:hypothetical protein
MIRTRLRPPEDEDSPGMSLSSGAAPEPQEAIWVPVYGEVWAQPPLPALPHGEYWS